MQSYEIKVSGITLTAQYTPDVAKRLGLTPAAESKAATPANKSGRKRAPKPAATAAEKETADVNSDAPADSD